MNELEAFGSKFWEHEYKAGGNSGIGSYGMAADFKAKVINGFLAKYKPAGVIEFGCGDGHQLGMINYPKYTGFDVSPTTLDTCKYLYSEDATKTFKLVSEYAGELAELTLSLDVIYHIIEQEVWENYLKRLFAAATKWVIIYATDTDHNEPNHLPHMLHRKFTSWVSEHANEWKQIEHVKNECPYATAFFIYAHQSK